MLQTTCIRQKNDLNDPTFITSHRSQKNDLNDPTFIKMIPKLNYNSIA